MRFLLWLSSVFIVFDAADEEEEEEEEEEEVLVWSSVEVDEVSKRLLTSTIFKIPFNFNIRWASTIKSTILVPINDKQKTTISTESFGSGTWAISATMILWFEVYVRI